MDEFEKYAFVDECGDTNLDSSLANVSTHYVITALIVDEDCIDRVRAELEKIRTRHFQTGEMKSRLVKGNDERRCRILKDLADLPFCVYCLVVDKRELRAKGYAYAETFFKNLNAKLYRILFRDFPVLKVIADEYKTTEFMQSFQRYVAKRFPPELFRRIVVEWVNSETEVLVQSADIVGGSIARHFDKKLSSPRSGEFLQILKSRVYTIETFPLIYTPFVVPFAENAASPFDKVVEKEGLLKATAFIQEYESSEDHVRRAQLVCLKLLLSHHFFHPRTFLSTVRLRSELSKIRAEQVSEHELRTKLIAGLRDANVLIASRAQGGYKLPSSLRDIQEFINIGSTQIVPFLERIQGCRKILWRATSGKLDILGREEYRSLREALPHIET